jgi:hypothetical protein
VRARSCLIAFVLRRIRSARGTGEIGGHELERVWGGLPFSVCFDLYLDAFIDVLDPAMVVYSKLEDIAILEFEWW